MWLETEVLPLSESWIQPWLRLRGGTVAFNECLKVSGRNDCQNKSFPEMIFKEDFDKTTEKEKETQS